MLQSATEYLYNHLEGVEAFESVYNGDGGYIWNNKDVVYPSVCFNIMSVNRGEETTVFNFRVTAANRQHESIELTTPTNYNLLYTALEKCFESMAEAENYDGYTFNIAESRTYQMANLKLMDVCAVVTVDIQIIGYNYTNCF